MKKHVVKPLAAATLLLAPLASAEIMFNGFASVRATSLDFDGARSPYPFLEFKGDGDISFKDESLFALQARSDLGDGLSATVQLMAEGKNDFEVEARWAYLSYQISDNHLISAGRLANPTFYQSEYEKVGYAHNFGRLPSAVYSGLPWTTAEGVALDSTFLIDDYTLTTKILFGNWDGDIPTSRGEFATGLKDMISLRAEFAANWWSVYAGYLAVEMEAQPIDGFFDDFLIDNNATPGVPYDGLVAGNAALLAAANGATIAESQFETYRDGVHWDAKDGIYVYYGFKVDYNNFLLDYEFVDFGVDNSSDAFGEGWYVSAGYRFNDKLTLVVHQEDFDQDTDDISFLNGVSDPFLRAVAIATYEQDQAQGYDATGITLRYNFHPSAALKVDYIAGEDDRYADGEFTLWSVGVDMIF